MREVAARAALVCLPAACGAGGPGAYSNQESAGFLTRVGDLALRRIVGMGSASASESSERMRDEAFYSEISKRLRRVMENPDFPSIAETMLSWLIRVDRAEIKESRPRELSVTDIEVFEVAWSTTLGAPLHGWVCSASSQESTGKQSLSVRRLLESVTLPALATHASALSAAIGRVVSEQSKAKPLDIDACWIDFVREAGLLQPVRAVGWRVWLDAFFSLLDRAFARVPVYKDEPCPSDRLVDATRVAAACAACLAQQRTQLTDVSPIATSFRLVSIEFTPIQEFVFGLHPDSPWRTDAALGGRSSFARLLVDLGSLLVLDRLVLPACCILNSAASKSLILVPDSKHCTRVLAQLSYDFDTWALRYLAGTGGLALAHVRVSKDALSIRSSDRDESCSGTLHRLAGRAAAARLSRFGMSRGRPPLLKDLWNDLQACGSFCTLDGVSPGDVRHSDGLADVCAVELEGPPPLGASSRMQLSLGRDLAVADVLLVARGGSGGSAQPNAKDWHFLDLRLSLIEGPASIESNSTLAAWDIGFSTRTPHERHFKGLAIRPIALPRGQWQAGSIAILKGDIDHLGQIFRVGLQRSTLCQSMRLSREVEDFFSIHVPTLLQQYFPSVQTVFSGGDDFVLLGPAAVMPTVASRLHEEFSSYCSNPSLTFSAGLCVAAQNVSLPDLVEQAERALALAKQKRDSISAHDVGVTWVEWQALESLQGRMSLEMNGPAPDTILCLEHLIRIIDSLGEDCRFAGVRWRAFLQSAVSSYVDRQGESGDGAPRFWRLVALLEEGVERHGRALLIPLKNLYFVRLYSDGRSSPKSALK